ncbi:MAG: EamA family transporter [Aestuariivirga sp.]
MSVQISQRSFSSEAAWLRRSLPAILVVMLGVIWGLQYASAKLAGSANLESAESLFIIHVLLALVFLPVLFLKRQGFMPKLSELAFFATLGFIGNIVQFGLQIFIAPFITSGELTLIVSLTPVFIVAMVTLFRTEPFCVRRVAAIGLGLAAAFAMIVPDAASSPGQSQWTWLVAALGIPFAAAAATVIMARFWPRRLSPLQVTAGNISSVAVMLLPVVLWQGGGVSIAGEISVGLIIFAATIGAEFFLLAVLVRLSGAMLTCCADFIAIGAGLGWGFVLFGEIPTVWMLAAASLCFVALKAALPPAAVRSETLA